MTDPEMKKFRIYMSAAIMLVLLLVVGILAFIFVEPQPPYIVRNSLRTRQNFTTAGMVVTRIDTGNNKAYATITNNTGHDFYRGIHFYLEYFDGLNWHPIQRIRDEQGHLESVRAGELHHTWFNLQNFAYPLPEAERYRIRLSLANFNENFGSFEVGHQHDLVAEFQLGSAGILRNMQWRIYEVLLR